MSQIDYPPVQQAMQRIRRLSADEEAQHYAMMRERAVHTEVTELRGAREDGRAEGLLEGKRSILIRLLEQRFGPMSDAQRACIGAADPAVLEEWCQRLFDATSIEDLLG